MYTFVGTYSSATKLAPDPRLQPATYPEDQGGVPLVRELCQRLALENIVYCHWKSNNALDRSANGDNDLDLLISRADGQRFTAIIAQLGFKQVQAPPEKSMPGVLDYYGYDAQADKLIHVHAHYQLMLGHDMTKNYRLPIEQAYLASARPDGLFMVPAPEFEYVVLIIRMILKHSTWDAILGREGHLKASERRELQDLQLHSDPARVYQLLADHLPFISPDLFDRCVAAVQPTCPFWTRSKTAHELQTQLQTYASTSLLQETVMKLWRRVVIALYWRIFKAPTKYRLERGGAAIALLGGDGAGKSTAVDALHASLTKTFEITRVHLGKPRWSWTTRLIRTGLKLGQLLGLYPTETSMEETLTQQSPVSPGYPWLVREICTARDRFLTYLQAQRRVANGGIVIFDRFPHEKIQLMDGPRTERFLHELAQTASTGQVAGPHRQSRLVAALVKLEKYYYQRMLAPEVLAVLVVNPEVAVQRKTTEDPSHVRQRSTEIWEADWATTNAHVIDASKPKAEVLAELKALLWSQL
jgi:thymidylate kinase